jgi:hypothetical protein
MQYLFLLVGCQLGVRGSRIPDGLHNAGNASDNRCSLPCQRYKIVTTVYKRWHVMGCSILLDNFKGIEEEWDYEFGMCWACPLLRSGRAWGMGMGMLGFAKSDVILNTRLTTEGRAACTFNNVQISQLPCLTDIWNLFRMGAPDVSG